MYLLSPEGRTVFFIPGVEVVHKAPDNLCVDRESKNLSDMEGKMQPPLGGGGRKRQNLTLDLNSASSKKKSMQNLLTSPDVQMLKLTSPELEKFLSQNPTLATPTPSGYIFPKSVTEEQIMYAKGFEEALEHLRATDPPVPGPSEAAATVAAATTLANLSSAGPEHLPLSLPRAGSRPTSSTGSYDSEYQVPDGVKIKDEPDDHSLSGDDNYREGTSPLPGFSPIDMEDQEKVKLERKRLRNRLAASKCRKRKLERISQLDERVAALKTENVDLAAVVKKMKASVSLLKQEVIEHVNSGCQINMTDNSFS